MDPVTEASRRLIDRQKDCLSSIRSQYPGTLADYVARDYVIACAHYLMNEPITYITPIGDDFPAEEFFDLTKPDLDRFKEITR